MKTKQIEITNYKNVYVAADGTEFDIQSECELFNGSGCDDNTSYVVIPKNEEEVGVIQQLVFLKAYNKEAQAEKVAVGKVLVVTFSYDDECAWVTDLGQIISDATDGKAEVKVK